MALHPEPAPTANLHSELDVIRNTLARDHNVTLYTKANHPKSLYWDEDARYLAVLFFEPEDFEVYGYTPRQQVREVSGHDMCWPPHG